ncbi:hypothetical protein MRX96_039198 [Rhipicephalus microplus]
MTREGQQRLGRAPSRGSQSGTHPSDGALAPNERQLPRAIRDAGVRRPRREQRFPSGRVPNGMIGGVPRLSCTQRAGLLRQTPCAASLGEHGLLGRARPPWASTAGSHLHHILQEVEQTDRER